MSKAKQDLDLAGLRGQPMAMSSASRGQKQAGSLSRTATYVFTHRRNRKQATIAAVDLQNVTSAGHYVLAGQRPGRQ